MWHWLFAEQFSRGEELIVGLLLGAVMLFIEDAIDQYRAGRKN